MADSGKTGRLRWAVGAALAVVVLLSWVTTVVFHGFPHSADEYAYVYQARTFLEGRLVNPPAPDPAAFDQIHVIDTAEGSYSKYPPGYPAVHAVGEAVGLGFLVNPVLTALLLLTAFSLVRRLAGDRVAAVTFVLLVTGPMLLLNGAVFLSHPLTTLLWLLALRGFLAYRDRPRAVMALGIGACFGGILLTRPQDFLFLIPGLVILFGIVARTAPRRALLTHVLVAAAPIAVAALAFLAYNAATTGNAWTPGHVAADTEDRPGVDLARGARRNVERAIEYLHVAWIALAVLLWAGPLRRKVTRVEILTVVLAGTFMAGYALYHRADAPPRFGPRYWLPAHPLVMFLAGWSLVRALNRRALVTAVALIAAAQLAQGVWMARTARVALDAAVGPGRAAEALAEAGVEPGTWLAITGPAGPVPPFDLIRNHVDLSDPVLLVRGDAPEHAIPARAAYLWEGAGGPPVVRAVDPEAPVQTVIAIDPPAVFGGESTPGWITTTASNRCRKYLYAFPGARPEDWARFAACGAVAVSTDAPPAPGESWPDTRRRWFTRHYRTTLVIDEPGDHRIRVFADDEARVWIDGREVLRAVCGETGRSAEAVVFLEAGHHPVTLAYANIRVPAHLTWSVIRAGDGVELGPDRYRSRARINPRRQP